MSLDGVAYGVCALAQYCMQFCLFCLQLAENGPVSLIFTFVLLHEIGLYILGHHSIPRSAFTYWNKSEQGLDHFFTGCNCVYVCVWCVCVGGGVGGGGVCFLLNLAGVI